MPSAHPALASTGPESARRVGKARTREEVIAPSVPRANEAQRRPGEGRNRHPTVRRRSRAPLDVGARAACPDHPAELRGEVEGRPRCPHAAYSFEASSRVWGYGARVGTDESADATGDVGALSATSKVISALELRKHGKKLNLPPTRGVHATPFLLLESQGQNGPSGGRTRSLESK